MTNRCAHTICRTTEPCRYGAGTTTDTLPATLVTVLPEYGGDAVTAHLPIRPAGQPFSGPTVYLTACGRYAHGTARGEAVAICVDCSYVTRPPRPPARCAEESCRAPLPDNGVCRYCD